MDNTPDISSVLINGDIETIVPGVSQILSKKTKLYKKQFLFDEMNKNS